MKRIAKYMFVVMIIIMMFFIITNMVIIKSRKKKLVSDSDMQSFKRKALEKLEDSKPLTKNQDSPTTDWTSNESLMDWLKSLGK